VQQRLQLYKRIYVKRIYRKWSNEKSISSNWLFRHETKYRVILYGYFSIFRILFLCCIPIIFLIKKINPADAMRNHKKNSDLHRSFIFFMEETT
jgi:hypothetical protein